MGDVVSNTPNQDDDFLSVNLGMLKMINGPTLGWIDEDRVGLRGSGYDTILN